MGLAFSNSRNAALPTTTPAVNTIPPTTQPGGAVDVATAVPAPNFSPSITPEVVDSSSDAPIRTPVPIDDVPVEEAFSFLSLADDEPGTPVYTLSVTDERVCLFVPSRAHFIEASRDHISLPAVKEGEIYHVSHVLQENRSVGFSEPSPLRLRKYTERNAFVCESMDTYCQLILPALLLGSRVRDYEQRCAHVVQLGELVLNMPSQRGHVKRLKLKTVHGEAFEVGVKIVQKNDEADKRWIVTCHVPTEPLPPSVCKGCNLEIMNDIPPEPRVTGALMQTYLSARTEADCWPLLACIYGAPGHRDHPPVAISDPSIRMKNGDVFQLNPQQAEAVDRYNTPSVPGFVIEAPPGSGKTRTAAAMAVSYKGKGVQLFLSTANVPVFNMALELAKLDYGSMKAIHFVAAECEEKMAEATRSSFSVLSLAKATEKLREKIERLEAEIAHAPNDEERRKLKDEMNKTCGPVFEDAYDIYFATVDMILGRLFKPNAGGHHKEDVVKKRLMTRVERVVVDEASQLTEAGLNALIHCFPQAQIVLIGDSKQLPPFRYEEGEVVSELAARPALEVMKDKKNLPVIKLRLVYRASQSLIAHYSHVFYDGTLVSCKKESPRNPLGCLGARAKGSSCLFWRVDRGYSKQEGTSKFNWGELTALKYIVNKLRFSKIDENDVIIISYYEAQRKKAQDALPGYEVLTVDSAQGREKRIVIVLTTRTSVPTDKGSFFNSPKRCNVAVSRHQEALIVLGHPSIADAPHWAQILSPRFFKHVDNDRFN